MSVLLCASTVQLHVRVRMRCASSHLSFCETSSRLWQHENRTVDTLPIPADAFKFFQMDGCFPALAWIKMWNKKKACLMTSVPVSLGKWARSASFSILIGGGFPQEAVRLQKILLSAASSFQCISLLSYANIITMVTLLILVNARSCYCQKYLTFTHLVAALPFWRQFLGNTDLSSLKLLI